MNRRILLTGGAGYIGSHTAVVLAGAGATVTVCDNFANSHPRVLDRLERLLGHPVPCAGIDIRDTDALTGLLQRERIDAVVHFAGLKAVGESVVRPVEYFDNNVGGTLSLLTAMTRAGVSTLVFSSSATVYGQPEYLPMDEAHPTRATNPYGRSKLHIEEILRDTAESDPRWRIACLRYFNPVGAHESGLLGEDPNGIPNNLMPYMVRVAAGLLPALRVFGSDYPTPDGTGVRDYIHVMDLARGHAAAFAFLDAHPGWHVFNLGTGVGHSVLEVIQAFSRATGRPIPCELVDRRPGDVACSYASAARAGARLGWRSRLDLETMCASAWRYQQNRMQ